MPEQIKSIQLKRFMKFKDNKLQVTQHNVLVGGNNSGKTSILHAIRLFFNSLSDQFSGPTNKIIFHKRYISIFEILPIAESDELWTDRAKGQTKATGVIIEIEFMSGLKIEAIFTHHFGQMHLSADVSNNPQSLTGEQINDAIKHKVAFIPGLVGILPREPYVTPARRVVMSTETRYSEMYRSALLHLNITDKKALKTINSILSEHLNVKITSINFNPERDVYVAIKYLQNGINLDLASAGSGMLQIIQLLVYIYLYKPTLLLIDEPDAHLHPELQGKLGKILKDLTEKMNAQLFVATHSPDVIDTFSPKEVFFINVEKQNLVPFKTDSEYVSNLFDSGIITNSTLSRIAVRPKCLVVEDTKIATLKAIDRILETKLFDFPGGYKQANGVSKFPTINDVYLAVQEVVGKKIIMFFIQDRDGLPDRYIDYIRNKYSHNNFDVSILERHEVENYLLDLKIVRAALHSKGKNVSRKMCRRFLIQAAGKIKADTRGEIRRKAKQVNHFCEKPDRLDDTQVEADVDKWFDGLTLDEATILKVFPGKELLRELRNIISDRYHVDIRESDLRSVLTKVRLSNDIKKIFHQIAQQKKG